MSLNCDISDFSERMDRISSTENLVNIEKRILRKGMSILRKEAKQQLKRMLPNSSKPSNMYDDKLSDGVMLSVQELGSEVIGKVHVMGTRRKTSGSFRLRFFEGGTNDRIVKKTGKSSGRIGALYFFAAANSSKEGEMLNKISDEWDLEIETLFDK